MRVSGNELLRTCQRAFEGFGLPAGVDRDAADMVMRLQLLGLPGTRFACAHLDDLRAEHGEAPGFAYHRSVPELDAHGRCPLSIGAAPLDLAYARAMDLHATATARVVALRDPLLMVGAAVAYGAPDHSFLLSWTERGEAYDFVVANTGKSNLFGDPEFWEQSGESPGESCTLTVACIPGEPTDCLGELRLSRGPPRISAENFAQREAAALAHGFEIPDQLWAPLAEAARTVLVPASDISRTLGAGAGQTDND